MATLEDAIKKIVENASNQIVDVIKTEHPKILATLAKEIFDSKGTTHGRQWESNKSSTVRIKGFDHRNYETGNLEGMLTDPGFLEDDDYMSKLGMSERGGDYTKISQIGGGVNRFDDIGKTDNDETYIGEQLAQKINARFNE